MKKQINPTIKAHLIRSAFYLLLLLAVCAIPFALAQRNTKRSVTKPNAAAKVAPPATGAISASGVPNISGAKQLQVPIFPYSSVRTRGSAPAAAKGSSAVTSGATGGSAVKILRMPLYPQVVLYDQYDNDLNNGIVSANRTDNGSLSAEAADNFVVAGGATCTVTEVDIRSPPGFTAPTSTAVNFYIDNGSGFPGTQVYTSSGLAVTGNPDYIITLTVPAVLTSGTYWVSAVGTISGTNWYREGRSITNNTFSTAWRNPGNGYGTGCTDWGRLTQCIGINWPDQMFRIVGTLGGATPTATPTCSPGETIVNGGFETGDFTGWVIDGHTNDPVIATNQVHSGTFSAFAGGNPQDLNTYCEENSNEPLGDSSFYQQFTVPAGGGTLSFWHMDCTNDSITFDWQDAYITDSS